MNPFKPRALLAAVLVAGAVSAATAPTALAVPCTDVHIVGLRGSGEPIRDTEHGMGSLVGPVADLIAEQAQGAATVSFHGLPYKAGEASITTVLSRSYFASKDAGAAALHDYLATEIAACPSEKIVVIGYSQGAHAAGDQLAKEPASVTDHVRALVMFGDPRFNPDSPYTWGTFDPRDHGINGARAYSDFASWRPRVFSVCNNGDVICQGVGIGHGTGAHKQDGYVSAYGSFIAGLVRRALGFPRPASATTPLDLAFVIDSTGSMGSSIAGVTAAAANIATTLKNRGADFRVGLVDFKDHGDPYVARVDLPMTSDASAFGTAVGRLTASGGGDTPEAVYSGLMTAIDGLSWRTVPRKAIILMGDAPAKNPEPVTGYTQASVLAAARALDPAAIHPVTVGSAPVSSFAPLAAGSGGQLFAAESPAAVAAKITAAVDEAAIPLYTSLTAGTPGRVGEPIAFSAAGSAYDAGEITAYRWDFDGNGIADATTVENRTTHVYDAPFTGIASVTVVTDDGHEGTVTAAVDVRTDAPTLPGAPASLRVERGDTPDALVIAWDAPLDLGGGTLAGYTVTVEGAAVAGVGPETRSVVIDGLEPGTYRVRVAAVNEAGTGPAAERDIVMATTAEGSVGAVVPATLALTLTGPATFGTFTPGVERRYTASLAASVISSAGDAQLAVADPGHLVNGAFALPRPLQVRAGDAPFSSEAGVLRTYDGPVANDLTTIEFAQEIGASDPLRTGAYGRTLTFSLSTTRP